MRTKEPTGKIIASQKEIETVSNIIRDDIVDLYKGNEKVVVVVLLEGAKPFCDVLFPTEFLREYPQFDIFYIYAKSHKGVTDDKYGVIVDMGELFPSCIKGNHVLIVDDIYNSGNTLFEVNRRVKFFGPASVNNCVLIEKERKHEAEVVISFSGFLVDCPEFLVGFGLDFNDKYRDLPYVATFNGDHKTGMVYTEILCNRCGESCRGTGGDMDGKEAFYGLINAQVCGSYFSPALFDETTYKFDLCEKCLKFMFRDFKIPVKEGAYNIYTGEEYV